MKKKRILVVDDSKSVREQVVLTLRRAGYEVHEAENGLEGAERIESDHALDMVISDIMMPKMNGLDMIDRVKKIIKRGLPVVVLTTEGATEMIKRARAAGIKGWIVKPFKEKHLVATVDKLTV